MTTEPESSIEVERKYDVDDSAAAPDWVSLPGVVLVDAPEPRELDARYFDTADGALARSLTALRRRTGGPDEGWHIKQSTPAGKLETRWPLGESDDEGIPAAILEVLSGVSGPPFGVVARIRNARTAYALRNESGALVAEFVDDRVSATDARDGRESSWREWELELGPAAPTDPRAVEAFFDVADDLVRAAGGRVAASGSKLARALGL